jgi:hypothetical protein
MDGLLFNVDRHLQRLKSQQSPNPTADRCLSLLNVLLRFARNSYHAVWFLTADTPPDHNRRPNYVLVVPSINRQLLDLLFSLVYMLDDFVGARLPASQGRRSGQRSLLVRSGGKARLSGTTGCGMAQQRDSFAEMLTKLIPFVAPAVQWAERIMRKIDNVFFQQRRQRGADLECANRLHRDFFGELAPSGQTTRQVSQNIGRYRTTALLLHHEASLSLSSNER